MLLAAAAAAALGQVVGKLDRVASLQLRLQLATTCVTGRKALIVVCVNAPNGSSEYLAILMYLGEVLPGDSVVLLGDFNTHVGNNEETWKGVIGRQELKSLRRQ